MPQRPAAGSWGEQKTRHGFEFGFVFWILVTSISVWKRKGNTDRDGSAPEMLPLCTGRYGVWYLVPCTLFPFCQFSHSCLCISVRACNRCLLDRWLFSVVVVQVSTGRQDTFCLEMIISQNFISPCEKYQREIQRRYLIICHYKYRSHSAACAAFTVIEMSLFSRIFDWGVKDARARFAMHYGSSFTPKNVHQVQHYCRFWAHFSFTLSFFYLFKRCNVSYSWQLMYGMIKNTVASEKTDCTVHQRQQGLTFFFFNHTSKNTRRTSSADDKI